VIDLENVIRNRNQAIIDANHRIAVRLSLLENKNVPRKAENGYDAFDLVRFYTDEEYRNQCIENYDDVKASVNVLDAVFTVPHFSGYLQSLVVAYKSSLETSNKFKTTVEIGTNLLEEGLVGNTSKDKQDLFKGIANYYSDYVRRKWMLRSLQSIKIPKGIKTIANGKLIDEECEIKLGTASGDASFKYIMENIIIPNLQKGSLGENGTSENISDNRFIKALTVSILTNTVTHNPIINYTLPINMLPSSDEERGVFNSYKSEFNKLQGYSYNLNGQKIPLIDLFYYYGLIVHYGKQGQQSLMPIFENLHDNPQYKLSDFHKFESSFDEDIPIDERELFPYILKVQNPYLATGKYIYTQDPETLHTELWEKINGKFYKEDIEALAASENIPPATAWYRIQKSKGAINGYVKKVNTIIRNTDVSNYYMVPDDNLLASDTETKKELLYIEDNIVGEIEYNVANWNVISLEEIGTKRNFLSKY
jgi:hypothetical protein